MIMVTENAVCGGVAIIKHHKLLKIETEHALCRDFKNAMNVAKALVINHILFLYFEDLFLHI